MPWFRLEDSFDTHPKVIAAGNEAVGLFVRCGTHAARHLTDGFIDKDTALLYGSPALADTLCRVKLWHRARGGWTIHDYLDYNPSREAVEEERRMKAERQQRWREKKRGVTRSLPALDRQGNAKSQGQQPVDNSRDAENAWSDASGRRVSRRTTGASKDDAPSPPRPEGKRGGEPAPKNAGSGRANPSGSPPPAEKPPWCGTCKPDTRQLELDNDTAAICPRCHPNATGIEAESWRASHTRQEPS